MITRGCTKVYKKNDTDGEMKISHFLRNQK